MGYRSEFQKPLRVILVDDDETSLLLMQAQLASEGYHVTTRSHSLGTSAEVCRENPDLVVLDVRMPGLSGDELADLLVANGTAVILHSGEEENTLRDLAKQAGALGYIVKSDDRRHFIDEFNRLAALYCSVRGAV